MWWFMSAVLVGALILGVSSGAFTNPESPPRRDRQTVSATEERAAAAAPAPELKISLNYVDAGEDAFANLFEQSKGPNPSVDGDGASAAPGAVLEVTGTRVNLRAEPSLRAPRLAQYHKGTRLELLRAEGAWKRVRNPLTDEAGWIRAEFVAEARRSQAG